MRNVFILFIAIIVQMPMLGQSSKNPDECRVITKVQFDKYVDASILNLKDKKLVDISDEEHRIIMMCLNTIFMAHDSNFEPEFKGGRYDTLLKLSEQKDYAGNITQVYPENWPNRGMGYYFPKIDMELYGTPRLYACFGVKR